MDDSPVSKKLHFSGLLRVAVLFVLLIAAFVAYMRYNGAQHASLQQVYDNLAVFDTRLQNIETTIPLLEKRLSDVEQKPAPPAPVSSAGVPDAEMRIASLEKEIDMLRSQPLAQDNEQLYQAIRLLSAFHRLSDKVIGGKPFASELSAFEELAGTNAETDKPIATLAPYADSGIPTFAILLASFDEAVDQLNAAEATPPENAPFWERFIYNLKHLITVRKVDEEQAGSSTDAILARATAHLEREEIEAAIAEIESLPDNARGNFLGWLDEAKITTEAPTLIDQIEEDVMQKAFHTEPEAQPAKGRQH